MRVGRRRIGFWGACVLLLALTSPARATGSNPPMSKAAKAKLDSGMKQFRAGHYDQATTAFEAGQRIEPRVEFSFALGQAARLSGNCQRAIDYFRAAIDVAAAGHSLEIDHRARQQIAHCQKVIRQGNPQERLKPLDQHAQVLQPLDQHAQVLQPLDQHAQVIQPLDEHAQVIQPLDEHAEVLKALDGHAEVVRPLDESSRASSRWYKKWWVWTAVAVVAVGVGLGVGLGVGGAHDVALPSGVPHQTVQFGAP